MPVISRPYKINPGDVMLNPMMITGGAAGPFTQGLGAKLLNMLKGGPKPIPPPANLPPPALSQTAGARSAEFAPVGGEQTYNANALNQSPLDGFYRQLMSRLGGRGSK